MTTQFCVTFKYDSLYRKSLVLVAACFLFIPELKSITAKCDIATIYRKSEDALDSIYYTVSGKLLNYRYG